MSTLKDMRAGRALLGAAQRDEANTLRLVAIGDSMMWGQGLNEEQKFAYQVAERLRLERGLNAKQVTMLARSGAILETHADVRYEKDRREFTELYPECFNSAEQAQFIGNKSNADGTSPQRVAYKIYNEIPASFPTVGEQLKILPAAERRLVDVVLLNGGANDIGWGAAMNPEGDELYNIHEELIKTAYQRFSAILRETRKSFPNALIVVPGYFPILRPDSSTKQLKELVDWYIKSEKLLMQTAKKVVGEFLDDNIPGLVGDASAWAAEHVLIPLAKPIICWAFSGAREDRLEAAAQTMIRRTSYLTVLADYWMSRAVARVRSEPGMRGNGMIFVKTRFPEGASLFGGNSSFVWGNYKNPVDPQVDERLTENPRADALGLLALIAFPLRASVASLMSASGGFTPGAGSLLKGGEAEPMTPQEFNAMVERQTHAVVDVSEVMLDLKLDQLIARARLQVSGPSALATALNAPELLKKEDLQRRLRKAAMEELRRHGYVRIASLMHPNARGAAHYTARIAQDVLTLSGKRGVFAEFLPALRSAAGATHPASAASIAKAYGLDPQDPDGEKRLALRPDTFAIHIVDTGSLDGSDRASAVLKNGATQLFEVRSRIFRDASGADHQETILIAQLDGARFLGELAHARLDLAWAAAGHTDRAAEIFVNGKSVWKGSLKIARPTPALTTLPYPAPIARDHTSVGPEDVTTTNPGQPLVPGRKSGTTTVKPAITRKS